MSTAQPHGQSPLPVELAAVWGAFLLEGLLIQPPVHQRIDQIVEASPQGFIELVRDVCQCLQDLWSEVHDCWHHPELFGDVFEYEVVSPLGRFIGDHLVQHNCIPSPCHIKGAIAELVENFFVTPPVQGAGPLH